MTPPIKPTPSLSDLVLVAWHALISNPNSVCHMDRFAAAEEAIKHAKQLQQDLKKSGVCS